MRTIQVKHIGPIKDTGVLRLRTVNLFIGKQSTGKSTLLKILSHCRWVEKLLCIGKSKNGRGVKYTYTHNSRFIQELIKFYRFDNDFFNPQSEIIYCGDSYRIEFKGGHLSNPRIEAIDNAKPYNAKLCFIPSERNLLSAIRDIESWYKPKDFDLLFNFIFEWDDIRESYTSSNALTLVVAPKLEYYYDKAKGEQLRSSDGQKEFSPFYASSGVQSALPLEATVNSLVKAVGTKANLSKAEIMDIVSSIIQEESTFNADSEESKVAKDLLTYKGAVFFIEEPEQNLFPESQARLINHIVALMKSANNKAEGKHSMTSIATHSPYILSALNVLMAASEAYRINSDETVKVIPEKFILDPDSIAAYYISEDGYVTNAIDPDIYMVNGTYIDGVSQKVEEALDRLNDIICQNQQ